MPEYFGRNCPKIIASPKIGGGGASASYAYGNDDKFGSSYNYSYVP